MTKQRIAFVLVIAVVVGVAVYLASSASAAASDRAFERALVLKDAEQITAFVQALELLREGRQDDARATLEHYLAEAAGGAAELARSGVELEAAVPNLRNGARRAKAYAEARELRDLARDLRDVLDALDNS